jgi:GNAT superfamily N-acetyltransferase
MNILRKLFGRGTAQEVTARESSLAGPPSGPILTDEALLSSGRGGVVTPEVMTDTSPTGMSAAIADGLEACFLLLATAPGGESHKTDGITVAFTGLPFFLFNGVFRTRLDVHLPAPELDRRIGEVVTYLRSRGVPFGWSVLPDDYPPDLQARLVASGFAPAGEQPGMAIALDQLGPAPQSPEGIAVAEVTDMEGIGVHMHLVASGSGLPPDFERAFLTLLQRLPFGPGKPIRYFLASEQGEPVGTSLVVLSGRVAGIFSVATVPQARGRGVGTLVTDLALRAAREEGHRIAILESSQMGYNVYRRIGFEEYCRIEHYAWTGEAGA